MLVRQATAVAPCRAVEKGIMRSGNKRLCLAAKPFKMQAYGLITYRQADYIPRCGLHTAMRITRKPRGLLRAKPRLDKIAVL